MEEEKKEVATEEVVQAEAVENAPQEAISDTTSKPALEVPGNKFALIAFILSVVGLGAAFAWFGAIVGVVLGIVGLVMLKKAAADRKPWSVFQRIAKPLCIAAIIVGSIMFLIAIIVTIIGIVAAALAATAEEALLLFTL